MVIRSSDSQGLLLHMPPPMLSGILAPTHTISYAVQNYQTLEQFLESLYSVIPWLLEEKPASGFFQEDIEILMVARRY